MKISVINFNPQINFSARGKAHETRVESLAWSIYMGDSFEKRKYPSIGVVDEEALKRASVNEEELNYRKLKIALMQAKIDGDKETLKKLEEKYQDAASAIEKNCEGLVQYIASKFSCYYPNLDNGDLFEEGMIGLREAIDRFNPILEIDKEKRKNGYFKKKNSAPNQKEYIMLSTYANPWINNSVRLYCQANASKIHIPRYIQEKALEIAKCSKKLKRFGAEPDIEKLSELTGYSVDEINEVRRHTPRQVSLYDTLHSNGDKKVEYSVLARTADSDVDYDTRHIEAQKRMNEVLEELNPEYAGIIRYYMDSNDVTSADIARDTGLSLTKITAITAQARQAIAELLKKDSLFGEYMRRRRTETDTGVAKKTDEVKNPSTKSKPYLRLELYALTKLKPVYNSTKTSNEKTHLLEVLAQLDEKERATIIGRLLAPKRLTQSVIGEDIGVMKERVRQIEVKALKKLNKILANDEFYSDYEPVAALKES